MVYLIICAVFGNSIIEFCLILDFAYVIEQLHLPFYLPICKSIGHINKYDDILHVGNISARMLTPFKQVALGTLRTF